MTKGTGVSTEPELRAPNKVYYPITLHLAPTCPQPSIDPNSASPSSSNQHASTPSIAPTKDKEQEQPPPPNMVDIKTEETIEVAQLKRKKRERERAKKEKGERKRSFSIAPPRTKRQLNSHFLIKLKCHWRLLFLFIIPCFSNINEKEFTIYLVLL